MPVLLKRLSCSESAASPAPPIAATGSHLPNPSSVPSAREPACRSTHRARPGREREAGNEPRIVGEQAFERNRDEDPLVAVIGFVSDSRVYHVGDRIPRAEFHADAKAPLDLEPRPVIPGEKPTGAHGERGLIRTVVVNGRDRGTGIVIS